MEGEGAWGPGRTGTVVGVMEVRMLGGREAVGDTKVVGGTRVVGGGVCLLGSGGEGSGCRMVALLVVGMGEEEGVDEVGDRSRY